MLGGAVVLVQVFGTESLKRSIQKQTPNFLLKAHWKLIVLHLQFMGQGSVGWFWPPD